MNLSSIIDIIVLIYIVLYGAIAVTIYKRAERCMKPPVNLEKFAVGFNIVGIGIGLLWYSKNLFC